MTLFVETTGQGPDLLLIHGWGLHGGLWRETAGALAGRFRIHCVDLPGYGASDPVASYTLDTLVAALRNRFPGPLHVAGWSLGGQVALRWALDHPQEIRSLVLVSTTPKFLSGPDWHHGVDQATLAQIEDNLHRDPQDTLARILGLQLPVAESSRPLLKKLRARLHEKERPDMATLDAGLAILRGTDLRDAVTHLKHPALVIHGDQDTVIPQGAGIWLSHSLPHAHFSGIAGAAHGPFLSHQEQVVEAMADFLHD
jgi:pimeloyl-[acyl-carrier protein] methyl ester esterase